MKYGNVWLRRCGEMLLGASIVSVPGFGQDKPMTDAQIEANVLKSLAAVPELADQAIGTTTIYGTVTLTGMVRDEASRTKAEQAVAYAHGVKKVVDELTIGTTNGTPSEDSQAVEETTNPETTDTPNTPISALPPSGTSSRSGGNQVPIERPQESSAAPPTGQSDSVNPSRPPSQPYHVQQAGQSIGVPAGTVLRVRLNQAMDSRHTQPGTSFDGIVMSDVVIGGSVAIPRGASVDGRVADVHPGGDLRGGGGLALELTQVILEGHPYPLSTETWSHQGYDKTGQTAGNTIGLGAVGATIGAIAGGGPGALLGAGIGAVAGLGISSASQLGEARIPSEAIVTFRLSQQAALKTVSQAELERLGAGLPPPPGDQQVMRRRYYPPPPPPYAYPYGPVYYPYPYYYRYYR